MWESWHVKRQEDRRPGLAMNYEGHDPVLLERVLPLVDYVEVMPDALAQSEGGEIRLRDDAIDTIRKASGRVKVLAHGVGLSIASADDWSPTYVRLLDDLFHRVDVIWHSEHLGYTRVDGEHLGTMLPPPRTDEALDLVAARVGCLQERYGKPFLIENIVHLLPDAPGDYAEAEFLNLLAARTGCGILLDAYNLECDAHNHGFDIPAFLDALDLSRVREVHVACGIEHQGFLLDVHSRPTRDSTVELAREIVARAGGSIEVVTYELLSEAVPVLGYDVIASELQRLHGIFCSARDAQTGLTRGGVEQEQPRRSTPPLVKPV